ncbi:flagellar hook-length control protein FliK [Stutzerimonas tarimensis]|uniref:Flagellar hook-length control protein FliK n=1 Tax=Stutzerimonas tarimensis TaxID=1507735 RepID=A0ABV7T949_9GAMM
MALLPHVLLPTPAEPRNLPPAKGAEARRDEPSSFSRVYDRERQARPTEGASRAPERTPEIQSGERSSAAGATRRDPERPAEAVDAASGAMEPSPTGAEGAAFVLTGVTDTTPVGWSASGGGENAEDGDPSGAGEPLFIWSLMTPVVQAPAGSEAAPELLLTDPCLREAGKGVAEPFTALDGEAEVLGAALAALAGEATEAGSEAGETELELLAPSPRDAAPGRPVPSLMPAPTPVTPTERLPGAPLGPQQAGFSEAVVERVMWMSSQNLKSAEIQLDPAELGRMEVRIEISKDQAQVTFLSPHAHVRDALEAQMHRLRELFAQQGLSLADASVSDHSASQGGQGHGSGSRSAAEDDSEDLATGVIELAADRSDGARGLVDYYA